MFALSMKIVEEVCITATGTEIAMPIGLLAMAAAVSAVTLTVSATITVGFAAVPILMSATDFAIDTCVKIGKASVMV